MSNDRSGFPGIEIAVKHFVCVLVGAPGPVHGAANELVAAIDMAPAAADA